MITGIEPCLAVVLAGRGLTRPLSYQVADELADGRLVRVLEAYEPPPIPVQLVTPSARLTPPRVRAFVDHAAAELSRLPVIRPR
jgi:DNA-binding transcriptional LysR family regulator